MPLPLPFSPFTPPPWPSSCSLLDNYLTSARLGDGIPLKRDLTIESEKPAISTSSSIDWHTLVRNQGTHEAVLARDGSAAAHAPEDVASFCEADEDNLGVDAGVERSADLEDELSFGVWWVKVYGSIETGRCGEVVDTWIQDQAGEGFAREVTGGR